MISHIIYSHFMSNAADVSSRSRRVSAKPYKGPAMEGMVATWYARITRDDSVFAAQAAMIASEVPAGARILEIAPGPGYLAVELARRGFEVTAIDISRTFVDLVIANAQAAGVAVEARVGNASELPCPDARFDFVICRAAFKNFSDPEGALDEIYRVLAPGGRASIIDLRKEATTDEIRVEVAAMKMSWLNKLWTRWTFRSFLLKNAYTREAIESLVAASKFGRCEIRRDGMSFDLRLARPAVSPSA